MKGRHPWPVHAAGALAGVRPLQEVYACHIGTSIVVAENVQAPRKARVLGAYRIHLLFERRSVCGTAIRLFCAVFLLGVVFALAFFLSLCRASCRMSSNSSPVSSTGRRLARLAMLVEGGRGGGSS